LSDIKVARLEYGLKTIHKIGRKLYVKYDNNWSKTKSKFKINNIKLVVYE